MALQAPRHVQRLDRLNHLHLLDRAVAFDAAHAGVDVGAVVEIDVIGQVVDLHPPDRRALCRSSARISASLGEVPKIALWQFMHTSVGGRAAMAAFSTVVWQ